MAVDYRQQYEPHQLEPFWPNEFIKMSVAVLCTLAVIMIFAILPVALDSVGLHAILHQPEPADPRGGTPVGIKPEWYFLASYQFLRLMPTELLGVSGKTLGVLSQGVLLLVVASLPFWYRRAAHTRPRPRYRLAVSIGFIAFIALTLWGAWPEEHAGGEEHLVAISHFVRHQPLLFFVLALAIVVFYALVAHEVRTIRRTLYGERPVEEQS